MNEIYTKVLDRVDIVDVIGRYIPLKKNGSNFKACCPFHQENTPSFVVSQTKQIFKCFGCGVAGNAVSFVKEYEKISYYEAALKLAKQYGIQVKVNKKYSKQKDSKTSLILQIYSLAKDFYRENLTLHGKEALEYLDNRHLSQNTIKTFELGFSLNSRTALYNYLRKNNVNKDILLESGIVKSNSKGYYDLFSSRIVFPIISSNGMTVAFGARSMDGSMPKYINSPTTAVYQKSKELYGFHTTKHEISKVDKVLICEGYLDFLRLYECGYHYAVASLGTSLTEEQVNLLRRYCKNFYIVYDGDVAGTKAAIRAAGKIIAHNGEVRIVALPKGEDPDSFLLKKGNEAFDKVLLQSPTYLQYLQKNMELDEAMQNLLEVASSIDNSLDQFIFTRKVAEQFGVDESVFSAQIKQKRNYPNKDAKEKVIFPKSGLEEQLLLTVMLSDKHTTELVTNTLTNMDFEIPEYKEIFAELQEAVLKNELNFNALSCQSKYPELWNELIFRTKSNQVDVKQLLKSFEIKKRVKIFQELDQKLKNMLSNNFNHQEIKEVLEEKKRVKKELIELGYNKTKV